MYNALTHYLNRRLYQDESRFKNPNTQPGPVICITREVGCGGLNLANMLAAEFEKKMVCKKWRVLSKEILTESARELDMDRNKLRSILKEGDRSLFDDILTAFSEKRFKSDKKIAKSMVEMVRSFAVEGNCIIVGRAGHIIARDIEKSLMIKLTAPMEWRVRQIMEKNNLNVRQAMEFIEKTEKERENFRRHFSGNEEKMEEFDLVFNLSRLSLEKTISIIKHAAEVKGLLEQNRSKVEVF